MHQRSNDCIVEKGGGKCNIVHTVIGKSDFVELNDPAYSTDSAPHLIIKLE